MPLLVQQHPYIALTWLQNAIMLATCVVCVIPSQEEIWPAGNEWPVIVQFNRYQRPGSHAAELYADTGLAGNIRIDARLSAHFFRAIPTDFLLVSLMNTEPADRARTVATLREHAGVRRVCRQQQYEGGLLSSTLGTRRRGRQGNTVDYPSATGLANRVGAVQRNYTLRRPVANDCDGNQPCGYESCRGCNSIREVSKKRSIGRHAFAFSESSERNDSHGATSFPWIGLDWGFNHAYAPTAADAGDLGMGTRFGATKLWQAGFRGAEVKAAVFDTGLAGEKPDFGENQVAERIDFTSRDGDGIDTIGHGTFIAGVMAGRHPACRGFAPDAFLYAFKVFNSNQESYTSWFLDAFNYALFVGIKVLNLSIGGPDNTDEPFVDKILELAANGIIIVSAIGNNGPHWGTLNNPADIPIVVGVGGAESDGYVASFSSRGMTNWELPLGYGRVKPDILAFARKIHGSDIKGGCKFLSGTSVAAPVVAGAVALLASTVPVERWAELVSPASIKQVLIEGAARTGKNTLFEEGGGLLDLLQSAALLAKYTPRASLFPASLDMTDCPRFWPWCTQPLYSSAMPVVMNVTILNGLGSLGHIVGVPVWHGGQNGDLLEVQCSYSEVLWPWSGWLAVSIRVAAIGATWSGIAEGQVQFKVIGAERAHFEQELIFPIRVPIVARPPRAARLLWDQCHSLQYPPGYIPRDALDQLGDSEVLDWHGDHPHTNFRGLYAALRANGYFLEMLTSPAGLLGFDAMHYGALILADPEEEFSSSEIVKLQRDVGATGLSLVVLAEWYDHDVLRSLRFKDDNTRRWWRPVTGGCNLPSLNDLLAPYGVEFAPGAASGTTSVELDGERHWFEMVNGVAIASFPEDGRVATSRLYDPQGHSIGRLPVLGLAELPRQTTGANGVAPSGTER
jgi:subtilisin family serine protease